MSAESSRSPGAPEHWARVRAAVEEVLDAPPEQREAVLDALSAGDASIRKEVVLLVAACDRAAESATFFGEPAPALAERLATALDGAAAIRTAATFETLRAGLAHAYTIEREIGAGGMATVYLALDRKHERRAAIKVLRPELSADVGAERFLAEIRVTARLQHPNVLPLFDSGVVDGLLYYVMPYVEGESLRDRLDRERQLPVNEALHITGALCAALDYAHRAGVIHRDLKPENILLKDGAPLIADFGIALAVARGDTRRMTATGLSLGTPRYMSPEQAAAEPSIDGRSDQFALACVLYEMLIGEPPHTGPSVPVVVARILSEPARRIRTARPSVPQHVDDAVDRALSKAPADRFATMAEFAAALATPTNVSTIATPASTAPAKPRRGATAWAIGIVAAAACAAGGWLIAHRGHAAHPATARFVTSALSDSPREGAPVITPDGQNLVYIGPVSSQHQILVRRIDELTARPLPGTEGAVSVFTSPDGRRIGFFTTEDKFKIVSITGGTPVTVSSLFRFTHARWVVGGAILMALNSDLGLAQIADSGGPLTRLTTVDSAHREAWHGAPLLLPDERSLVFTVVRQRNGPGTLIGELAAAPYDRAHPGPHPHTLLGVQGREAVGSVDGWLLFLSVEGNRILATRLDPVTSRATGPQIAVLQDSGGVMEGVSLAKNGTLIYSRRRLNNIPVLVDLSGASRPLLAGLGGAFMNPRLSPDGTRLAIQALSPEGNDVWVYDLASNTPTRLTSTGSAQLPSWTPDGESVVYWSQPGGGFWRQRADGTTPPERLVQVTDGLSNTQAGDAKSLVFERRIGPTWSIWAAPLSGDRTPTAFLNDDFDNSMPTLSPNGKWLAYTSNSSGRADVYARPFPGPGAAVQLSTGGGIEPVWSPNGRSLYYRGNQHVVAVSLAFEPRLVVTARRSLFDDTFDGDMPHANFDVTRDGKQFVMVGGAAGRSEIVVILDWLSELRAKLADAAR